MLTLLKILISKPDILIYHKFYRELHSIKCRRTGLSGGKIRIFYRGRTSYFKAYSYPTELSSFLNVIQNKETRIITKPEYPHTIKIRLNALHGIYDRDLTRSCFMGGDSKFSLISMFIKSWWYDFNRSDIEHKANIIGAAWVDNLGYITELKTFRKYDELKLWK